MSDKSNKSPEHRADSIPSSPETSPRVELDLPVDERSKPIFELFKSSVKRLSADDRTAVMDQFGKLQGAFALLSKSVDGILSTEEGRRLFEQELRRRQ